MLGDIGAAALYGAIGGGAGAVIGTLLAMPFKGTKFEKTATLVLTVAAAVIGINVAEPLLSPYLGKYLPTQEASVDKQFDAMMGELEEYPAIAAIVEREPGVTDELRLQMKRLMEDATSKADAKAKAFQLGFNFIIGKLNYYAARATDADLIDFMTVNVEIMDDLAARDVRFCYNYLYNPVVVGEMSVDAIRRKIGPDLYDRQQEQMATMVRNAADDIPAYDALSAQGGVNQAAQVLQQRLGEKIIYVTGQIPESDDDARLVCETTSAFYQNILGQQNAARTARHLFASML